MALSLSPSFRNYRAYGLTLTSNLPLDPWLQFSNRSADLIVEGCQVAEAPPSPNVPPLFASQLVDQSGKLHSSLHKVGEDLYFTISRIGVFLIARHKIQVQFQPGTDLVAVCAIILSTVFSLWLEQHRIRALHASCLVYQGKAAAFIADSTTGKSTLAAALLQAGADLLSDDIVPIAETSDGFFAYPGYPSIRLSEVQARQFLGDYADLAHWFPTLGKALVPIGVNGWGKYCDTPQRIQRLYLLHRIPNSTQTKVQFNSLSKTDSVLSLIRFSFNTRGPLALGIAAERMAFFARLVAQARVTNLTYPSGYEHLADVARRIFQDMDESEGI